MKKSLSSFAELAKFIGRSKSTAHAWAAHDDWPFNRTAPWPAAQAKMMRSWAADHLKSGDLVDGTNSELRRHKLVESIRKLHAEADAAEANLIRTRENLIDAKQAEADWKELGAEIRQPIDPLAPMLVELAVTHGLPAEAGHDFQQQIAAALARILRPLDGPVTRER